LFREGETESVPVVEMIFLLMSYAEKIIQEEEYGKTCGKESWEKCLQG
jgi:hypothetical protein